MGKARAFGENYSDDDDDGVEGKIVFAKRNILIYAFFFLFFFLGGMCASLWKNNIGFLSARFTNDMEMIFNVASM